jgi:hypothetical protein
MDTGPACKLKVVYFLFTSIKKYHKLFTMYKKGQECVTVVKRNIP